MSHLIGRSLVAESLRGLPVSIEEPFHQMVRHEYRQVRVHAGRVGAPLHRLLAAKPGYPDRRMRLLQRARPYVYITNPIVLAFEWKRAGLRPRLQSSSGWFAGPAWLP